MKPAQFGYVKARSVDEAVGALSESDDAKVLAGGQSLVPLMNFRLAEPPVLVDVNGLTELAGITETDGSLRIGAMTRTRQLELSPLAADRIPVLAHAAGWVGHVQIRNRGTVGGSVAHADPSAELPAMCVLLDAEMTVVGPRGTRAIRADDFFEGILTTTLDPDELLTEISVPIPATGAGWGFSEYAQRHGDFAVAGVGCVVDPAAGTAAVVAFGPSSRPIRCPAAEEVLRADGLHLDLVPSVADAATSDVLAATEAVGVEAQHRVETVRAMTRKAVGQAIRRTEGQR
jgi:CO/xanthine dehydrogenase FAD-binding subunit